MAGLKIFVQEQIKEVGDVSGQSVRFVHGGIVGSGCYLGVLQVGGLHTEVC